MKAQPYLYRRLTKEKQEELLRSRRLRSLPAHEPPHYPEGEHLYFVTAACYEHTHILNTSERRLEWAEKLLQHICQVHAWVVLPNHYHLVVTSDLAELKMTLAKLHNGTATQWNREDVAPARHVWYRFVDRKIRSDAHYYASVNYVHWNPVKHGYATQLQEWETSSFGSWLDRCGRDQMVRLWRSYPVGDYGKEWDTF